MNHSIADCPLRTFCTITTTDQYPFTILSLDQEALDLFLTPSLSHNHGSSSISTGNSISALDPSVTENCAAAAAVAATKDRARAVLRLRGKSILDILLPDHDSFNLSSSTSICSPPLSETTPTTTEESWQSSDSFGATFIQPFVISQDALVQISPDDTVTGSTRYSRQHQQQQQQQQTQNSPKRVHCCVHPSVPVFLTSNTSSESEPIVIKNPKEEAFVQSCRVYVLKDVTRIHDLALAAQNDLARQPPSKTPSSQRISSQLPSFVTSSRRQATTTATTAATVAAVGPLGFDSTKRRMSTTTLVIQPKLYPPPPSSLSSPSQNQQDRLYLSSSKYGHTTNNKEQNQPQDNTRAVAQQQPHQTSGHDGLLMLQVTQFGTIDHAFTVMPPSSSSSVSASASPAHSSSSLLFLGKDRSAIEGMTNNSVMSFVHPEDLRILCRGLDRVCKALYTQFRVRWRVHTSPIVTPQTESNETISACADFSASDEMLVSPKKTIEFQGEIFEEWIDPTGMEYFTACKNVISAKDSSDDEEEQALFAWTEIKGVISQGQPMLVIRPLTAQERIQMQLEEEASSAIESSRSRSYQDNDKENDGDETDEAYESAQEASWKIKSKRMGLEERMTLPKQLNLSALTTLSIEERSNRMPGSFPLTKSTPLHLLNNNNNSYSSSMYTQQQPSSSSFTRCYSSGTHSRTSSGWMTMPAAMAYPATVSPPWTVVMTVALDAWKKWIQTVHAGQAQFKDWCEYVLVLTFDQAIEGVSLGLTLLGVEGSQSSKAISRLSESEEVEEEDEGLGQDLVQHQQQHRRHLRAISSRLEDPSQETQPTMTGMDRVGKILEAYPSVDGVVKQIGGSWLGQMVKFRLEHKLERVAGQVVNWWDRSAPLRAAAAGTAHGNIQVTEIQHQ